MYDDQERPPWLRNLRTPRAEAEAELYPTVPAVAEPAIEAYPTEALEPEAAPVHGTMNRRQMLLLALLLWLNVSVLGCLCLLATQTVRP
jgi:hypothetical protein